MTTKIFIIKIGGNVLDHPKALQEFLQQLSVLNVPMVLIHGGGKIATKIGSEMGILPNYVDGRRITDEATRDLVTMVYGGLVNKQVVAQLQSLGKQAIGLTGVDGNLIPGKKRAVKTIDYGWVGDLDPNNINISLLLDLLQSGYTPVIAPLSHDKQGHLLNTNADTIASAIAIALSASHEVRLIYCFEKKGVLLDIEDDDSVVTLMDTRKRDELMEKGALADGIIPKIDNAFAALHAGVKEVLIGHADDLTQNVTAAVSGTLFVL